MGPSSRSSGYLIFLFSILQGIVYAQTFTPILPPSYPLAVKNPYLSAWLPGEQAANLPSAVPQFWNGDNLTWSVIARVDGRAYSLFGVPYPDDSITSASFECAEYTSTHTIFTLSAGSANFILDFFSPVTPQNYIRQSLPLSYLTVSATGRDGAEPSVQVYSDIDNSWAGQYGTFVSTEWGWGLTSPDVHVFTLSIGGAQEYVEVNDRAQWGTAFYCTRPSESILTEKLGDAEALRSEFTATGTLVDSAWQWNDGSVVAFSQDLGSVGSEQKFTTFVVGYAREADVNYRGSKRTGFWRASIGGMNDACSHAFDDLPSANSESRSLDRRIVQHVQAAGGQNYSDIVTLSARQVFGAMDITIAQDTLDTSDVLVFTKEISSNGNTNTVDVIFPLSPILYIMAPDLIRLLMEPTMRYLDTGAWPLEYMIHDLGTHYPNATGHDDGEAEPMPVEECGNVLILAYMYQKSTGDSGWTERYFKLFQRYADYLVDNGLYPEAQLSSDDGAGVVANQTGLAIKAAIALNAYGQMTDQQKYIEIGHNFARVLFTEGEGTDDARTHFTLQQGDDESWGLAYNLYPDLLLGLNTFPTEAYTMQSDFYPSVRAANAVPLDSRSDWAKTDWMIWAGACAAAPGAEDDGIRDMFVDDVHGFLTNDQNTVPFSDNCYTSTEGDAVEGNYNLYRSRPVVGGHFALMALGDSPQIRLGDGGKG